ncbi:hypothetical protein [Maridesulfovibrio sp.]|uniref:hypothetical protein n=1 Tax=Maridesulfovibrio sp. TaxID=2795000 RepID=UPI0029CA506D|nr:hypothetical protein [Maridesulfovibrio sp.]
MREKFLPQEAKASAKAIVYQLAVAVKYCYDMCEGDIVYIEELGDVTNDKQQVEVKCYDDCLTDNHVNLWKTLSNWSHKSFCPSNFKSLVLWTTQRIGPKSTLGSFEALTTSSEKENLLLNIHKESLNRFESGNKKEPSQVLKYQMLFFADENEDKRKQIIDRLAFVVDAPNQEQIVEEIKQVYLKDILKGKQSEFIEALIGFVSRPSEGKSASWEITYNEFTLKVQLLSKLYSCGTQEFPRKYIHSNHSVPSNVEEKKFVTKIQDIEYDDVVNSAVQDYYSAMHTISDEISNYQIGKEILDNYTSDIMDFFERKYRSHSRKCSDVLCDSQNFYDEITEKDAQPFADFSRTPERFRNGLIHAELDDDEKQYKWILV